MLCHTLALILLAQVTHPTRTAYVTSSPLLATIDRILEKLENLTVAPKTSTPPGLSDDDEELLSAVQTWTWGRLTPDQLDGVAKDLQSMKAGVVNSPRLTDLYYADMEDEEYSDIEYHNDGEDDEDIDTKSTRLKTSSIDASFDEDESPISQRPISGPGLGVTPSAFTRNMPYQVISAVDPIAATNERPRILDDSALTPSDRKALRDAIIASMKRVLQKSKCLVPQARWLSVRQLAPASDTLFMPPCVELHRCAPDAGCCDSEADVCAPIDGRHIVLPFYLHKADGNMSVARMVFFNHTKCACVSRETLQRTVISPIRPAPRSEERQNDWRPPAVQSTVEPKSEDDVTAPPQMRRCTCPTPFLASMPSTGPCTCGCGWRELSRRRDCVYIARGKEHLGLRDRVCIEDGDCDPPACEYGAYDPRKGKCPKSLKRRFHEKRHHQERNSV